MTRAYDTKTVGQPWANAFGNWSVVVLDIGTVKAQRERARRAIAREVAAREGTQRPIIRLGRTTEPVVAPGAIPYRVWREDGSSDV